MAGIRQLLDLGINLKFDLVGEGPERQRLTYTIHDLGLNDHVTLHGRLPQEKIREILQNSDVYLSSSVSEGISNAVLEAMSCGLPVVTTECGGMREAVTNGSEGLIVPVRDSNAICLALAKLAGDNAMRSAMGIRARKTAIEQFNIKNQIKSFDQFFRDVAGCGLRPAAA